MSAGIRLGLCIGLLFGLASAVLDPSTAGFLIFGAVALKGIRYVWILHTRTPFRYLVGADVVGVLVSGVIAILSLSDPAGAVGVSRASPWLFAPLLLVPVALFAESRLRPDAWRTWGESVEQASVLDMLTGRSVPRLLGVPDLETRRL